MFSVKISFGARPNKQVSARVSENNLIVNHAQNFATAKPVAKPTPAHTAAKQTQKQFLAGLKPQEVEVFNALKGKNNNVPRVVNALVNFAAKTGNVKQTEATLKGLAQLYRTNANFRSSLNRSDSMKQQQWSAISKLLTEVKSPFSVGAFLNFIFQNRKRSFFIPVVDQVTTKLRILRGEILGTVTTARPITDAEAYAVAQEFAGHFPKGTTFKMSRKVDPTIMGGMVLHLGSRTWDHSVRAKFDQYKTEKYNQLLASHKARYEQLQAALS